tara:strand:+ start:8435 stop:9709 length:1275 start_codon:yes stop_codon:yes gene_type:complete
MSGALLQLVAVGAQDKLFTSNPEITFFALKYRSYSNFAVESIDQTINGTAGFGRSVSCTVSRNGDLISRVAVEVSLPNATELSLGDNESFAPGFANHLVKTADIEIGGQRIDRHYGKWMHVWDELAGVAAHRAGKDRASGNHQGFLDVKGGKGGKKGTVTVPLQFWFCRHPGLALPLIALQYHEVKINITFSEISSLLREKAADWQTPALTASTAKDVTFDAKVWVDYIYLDNEERRRMAQQPHQYLIDQLQYSGSEAVRGSHDRFSLNFNHPVKELVWCVNSEENVAGVYSHPGPQALKAKTSADMDWSGNNPVSSAKLVLNGHDRFKTRDGTYFDSVQPSQHHSNTPSTPGINVFSFALKPEEFQPSGTCNFSRIDNASLEVNFDDFDKDDDYWKDATVDIYATNYNQLRIMSGMGGLTYSN